MGGTPMDAAAFTDVYEKTMPSIYRLCYSYVQNRADTLDLVQTVYLKYFGCGKEFKDGDHCKAWLIVTAKNLCKNHLRHWWFKKRTDPPADLPYQPDEEGSEVREAVLALPVKYKTLIFLYYYEGYDTNEIAVMLKKNSSTVRRQLAEARAILGGVLHEKE
jgi:RNA polymerase sigma-70 factor (ECF subfamily)